MSADPLQQLEDWAAPLLAKLSPAEQRQLARTLATELRRSQAARIARQQNPDGSAYAPRKRQRNTGANRPRRFLYYGQYSSDGERAAEVKSYRDEGDRLIGYDIEAGGIRTFFKSNMTRHMKAHSSSGGVIRGKRAEQKAMFDRLRKKLKVLNDASGVAVGFVGRTERIAEIHHYGLRAQVRPGKSADYAARRLLGFSDADREMVLNRLLERLTP